MSAVCNNNRHSKLVIRVLVLIMMTGSITGCVYLRLLEFKRQLADFDQYFQVEAGDDFTLIFKKPILYRDDFNYLTKLQPSGTEHLPSGTRSFYEFKKIDSEGRIAEPHVDLRLTLNFNKDDILTHWTYSPIFLAMVPAEFLEVSLRSLGSSKINRSKRQVKADLSKMGEIKAQVPTKNDIGSVLGAPLQVIPRENEERLLYRFKLQTTTEEQDAEERQFTLVKLDFNSQTQQLLKVSGRFVGMKLSVDYRKFQQKSSTEL